jgi:hypothetical protein
MQGALADGRELPAVAVIKTITLVGNTRRRLGPPGHHWGEKLAE